MVNVKGYIYLVILCMFSFFVVAEVQCYLNDGNETACTTGDNATVCQWSGPPQNLCDPVHCSTFSNNDTCVNASTLGLPCQWDEGNNFCMEVFCGEWQGTNASACENNTAGLNCTWESGPSACIDPHHSQGCEQFNNQQSNCLATGFCLWDNDASECNPPAGADFGGGAHQTIGCQMIPDQDLCFNMTGCSWDFANGQCQGPGDGIGCPQINDSELCSSIPILPTCCSWNGTACNADFSQSCWDNIQAPPEGGNFCGDFNARTNQTMCEQIAGAPWFMPCKWDNKTTENTNDDSCGFNGESFFDEGGKGHFEDIGSKSNCEAAGGIWRSESYVEPDGSVRTENWCEMNFGHGTESCDSSCWACEKDTSGSDWVNHAVAEAACHASSLGFCHYRNDSNAPNGLGFCEQPPELAQSGCGLQTSCSDYEYYAEPESSCNADEDCRWIVDADRPSGYCGGANVKTCDQSCGQCVTENSCLTNGTSCTWDQNSQLCKSQSGNTEICFNGVDDDNDNQIDCQDSGCISDPFCGGGFGADCFQYSNDSVQCGATSGCSWVNDTDTGQEWCDVEGANCWLFDDNETCSMEAGCQFETGQGGFCEVNHSLSEVDGCLSHNATACDMDGNCTWINNSFGPGGFCDHNAFACEFNHFGNETSCNTDSFCNWTSDPHFPGGGRCEATCFQFASGAACDNEALCASSVGLCEPTAFKGGGCFQFDGNQSGCQALDKCVWRDDPFGPGPDNGFCNDEFMETQFQGMDEGPPVIVAEDSEGCGAGSGDEALQDSIDICGIGIKDMKNAYGFGFGVDGPSALANTMFCNGQPINMGQSTGSGNDTASYYLYVDSDNNETNGCNSSDNMYQGFEFFFKYETRSDSGSLIESRVAQTCKNSTTSTWQVAPIPINTWPEMACNLIGAAIMAVDKDTLESYDTFNKSAALRVYGTTSNVTNASQVIDSAGPGHYLTGSVDFIAEDCRGTVDLDGDGCAPSEDPDCAVFNQFGFIPFEDCRNGVDDNYDGTIDCDDPQCAHDPFICGGSLVADPNDVTPPSLAWSEVITTPEGAFVELNTFEPSNATLSLYAGQSGCTTVNDTVEDSRFVPWHHLPVDNFAFNPDAVSFTIESNTTYHYKYSLCDISDNCLVSACSNFTTEASYDDCGRSCATFLDPLDFTPPAGSSASDPLGHLEVKYDTDGDGGYDVNKTFGDSSSRKTLNETRNVNIKIENPNASTKWAIECINGTIPTSVAFNSSNLEINDSSGEGGMVGMPTAEYTNKFITDFGCKAIRITVPNNAAELFNCANDSITNVSSQCINVTANATLVSSDSDLNCSTWEIDPQVIGFSLYTGTGQGATGGSGGSSSSSDSSSSSSGGGGSGAGIAPKSADFEKGAITFSGKKGDTVRYLLDGNSHTVNVKAIRGDEVDLIIKSVLIQDSIRIGQTKQYDVDGDGSDDISIFLESVKDSAANLVIKLLSYKAPAKSADAPVEDSQDQVEEQQQAAEQAPVDPTSQPPAEQAPEETSEQEEESGEGVSPILIGALIVLVAIVVSIFTSSKKPKHEKKKDSK